MHLKRLVVMPHPSTYHKHSEVCLMLNLVEPKKLLADHHQPPRDKNKLKIQN
jgi:hypothetical protein